MNRGLDDAELLAAFSQIVVKRFREMLKDTVQHGEEDMFALAETSEDLFFRTHVCDVLNELRQETLAIQLSFAADLRNRFQTALSKQGTAAQSGEGEEALPPELAESAGMLECQELWLPEVERLADLVAQRSNRPIRGDMLRLPLTPMDVASAYFRALDSIRLPVHTQIRACLADLLAKCMNDSLARVYGSFADYLESDVPLEPEEEEEPPQEAAAALHGLSASHSPAGADVEASAEPVPDESEAAEALPPNAKSSGPPRMGPLEALIARQTGTTPQAVPEPVNDTRTPKVQPPAPPEPVPMNKGLAFAGAACLLIVALLLGRHVSEPEQNLKPASQVLSAQPPDTAIPTASTPSSASEADTAALATPESAMPLSPATSPPEATPPVTAALEATDLDEPTRPSPVPQPSSTPRAMPAAPPVIQASAKPTLPPHKPLDTPAPKARHGKKAEEPPRARPTPSPSPSATPEARAAAPAVLKKLKLRGYDWVRGRDDGSIFMKLSVFNGSPAHIRRIKVSCTAYSDGLVRLQTVGKSVDASIAPGATHTLRHINLGRLHKNMARISCAVDRVEVR